VLNVIKTPFWPFLAKHQNLIVKVVLWIVPLESRKVTLTIQDVSVNERNTTQVMLITASVSPAQSVPIALLKMDSCWLNLQRSLDIGDQALIVTSFHHVLLGTVR